MGTLDHSRSHQLKSRNGTAAVSRTRASVLPDWHAESGGEPGASFAHPAAVIDAATLTGSDKRALLALWASDACAVENQPALRWLPGTPKPVCVDDLLDALRSLDSNGLH